MDADEEFMTEITDVETSGTVDETEDTVTDDSVTENTVAENTVAENTVAENTVAENTVTEETGTITNAEKTSSFTEVDAGEITRLREELAREKETFAKLAEGYEELSDLYPGADLRSMPDSFRENVRRGVPPAAAYALEMRRREVDAARAAEAERLARESSAGGLRGNDSSLFSPDEVRAMSRDEVRTNFGRILESMKSW